MPILILLFLTLTSCASFKKEAPIQEEQILVLTNEEQELFKALRFKDKQKALELIPKVRINVKDSFQETYTHVAIHSGINFISLVIEKGALVDSPTTFLETPLSLAVKNGLLEEANFLLSKGANVDQKEMLGSPLFFTALEKKDLPMLKLLMKYNFNPLEKGFMNKTWEEFKFAQEEMRDYIKVYKKQDLIPEKPIKQDKGFLKRIFE